MPSKDVLISRAEYDDMNKAVVLLDLILNSRGTGYDLERIVNSVRVLQGVEIHEEGNGNA